MHTIKEKITTLKNYLATLIKKVKGSKRLSMIAIVVLVLTIIPTVSLALHIQDIRQHADFDPTANVADQNTGTGGTGPSLSASVNPCILTAQGTCSTTISWNAEGNPAVVLKAKVENAAELDVDTRSSGTREMPWITNKGVTFNLYSGTTLLQSLYVGATAQNTLTAWPNPCVLKADGTCTVNISWSTDNKPSVKVTAQVGNSAETTFNETPSYSKAAPWVTNQGVTFRLYSGTTLLNTVSVAGIAQNTIAALPTPCVVNAQEVCTSTIFWSTEGKTDVTVKAQVGDTTGENGGGGGGNGPEILFSNGPYAAIDAPWITTQGVTFRLYSGTTLVSSVFAKGVVSSTAVPTSAPGQPVPTTAPGQLAPFTLSLTNPVCHLHTPEPGVTRRIGTISYNLRWDFDTYYFYDIMTNVTPEANAHIRVGKSEVGYSEPVTYDEGFSTEDSQTYPIHYVAIRRVNANIGTQLSNWVQVDVKALCGL